MVKILRILIAFSFISAIGYGQYCTHLQVKGRHIIGTFGDTIILRGVNYAPYNWGYTANENFFDQIALTKANSVRIVWFKNSTLEIYNNPVNLDSTLARCVRAKMIPILELHDATCSGNMADVTALLPFYTSAAFMALEQKYRNHLIINIANEAGFYGWSANPSTALNTYKTTYKNAIITLRNNGLKVPIMIDAPDCGTNADAFSLAGAEMLAADVLSNTMFSVHGYWYGFAGNNPAIMQTKVQALYNSGLCVFFGEIANQQDDASPCQYNLAYSQLLAILKTFNIGWSAWGWYHDVCPLRQISNNGNANNLSAYGNLIVNDASIGLKATAVQALQFTESAYNSIFPATPGIISGTVNPCTNIVNGTDAIYSIRKIPLATAYNWSTINNTSGGAGSIIITGHPGGTGENDTIVAVRFTAGFRTGNIKVQSVRHCSMSLQRILTVTTKKVETPVVVNGNTIPCIGATEEYSCPLVANASGYKWTAPLNAKILSGQGTNRITVLYPAKDILFKPGNISVMALSPCGNSGKKSLYITNCSGLITRNR